MPPRKRASQTSKHESPKSPTASSKASPDQHHLRHTGPSISTRAATSKPLPVSAQRAPTSEDLPNEKHAREKTQTTQVSQPGARTSLAKFIYLLLFLVLLFLSWNIWGIVVIFGRLKEEMRWWDTVAGDSGVARWEVWEFGREREGGSLEGSLEALANALGVSPVQVASAVKPLVPQASIASKMEGRGSSEAVRVLFEDISVTREQGSPDDVYRPDSEGLDMRERVLVETGDNK